MKNNVHILIAEDEIIQAENIRRKLEIAGYEVAATITRGENVLQAVKDTAPNLILMDIQLKGEMNGIEAATQVRSYSNVPIIFISAQTDIQTLKSAQATQPHGYLIKPFRDWELRAQIELALHSHRQEQQLRIDEERLRKTFEQAAIGVTHITIEGGFLRANQRFRDIIGYSLEEIVDLNLNEIIYPDDPTVGRENLQLLLAGETESCSMEKRLICKDGHLAWVNLTASLARTPSGEPDYFIGIIEDISKRKQIETALQASESLYRSITERANDGIMIIQNRHINFANPRLADMLGYPLLELLDTPFLEYFTPSQRTIIAERHRRRIQGMDEPERYESTMVHRSGKEIPIEINVELMEYQDKPATLAVVRDISERKWAEEALRQANEALEARVAERTAELQTANQQLQAEVVVREQAEHRLAQALEDANIFRQFAEASGQALGMATLDGDVVYANPTLVRMLGFANSEALYSKNIAHSFSQTANQDFREKILPAIMRTGDWRGEAYLTSSQGNVIPTIQNVFLIRDDEGNPLYLANIITDITERKRAEDALRQQLNELTVLHAAAVASSEAIGERTLIDHINHLLDTAFSPMGYTIWLIDEKAQILLPHSSHKIPGSDQRAGEPLNRSVLGEITLSGEIAHIADLNDQKNYPSMLENAQSVLCAPVKIGDQVLGVISAESQQLNAFKAEDERFLTTLARQFGVALVRLRAQAIERQRLGQIEALNKMGQTVTSSLNPEDVFQKIMEEVVRVVGAGGSSVLFPEGDDLVFAAANGEGAKSLKGQPVPLDNSVAGRVYRSGKSAHIADARISSRVYQAAEENAGYQVGSLLAAPLILKGQIIGVMEAVHEQPNMFNDASLYIMEAMAHWAAIAIGNARQFEAERAAREQAIQIQRLTQQALEQTQKAHDMELARQAAEAANQAKSVFVANMSHELRTPLNGILGFVQLLQNDPSLTKDQREQLNIIARSGEHLLLLINSVLELSKIEAGRVELNNAPFDVLLMLDSIVDMFTMRAHSKGLSFSLSVADNLPHYVTGDESKIRQVLINLVGNALKFTRTGSVILRTGLSADQPKDRLPSKLIFEVEDTGSGIAPDEFESIFKAFAQSRSSPKNQEGSGLGLTISRQYARLMGGDISVESELGRGSTFRFEVTLPLADPIESALRPRKRQVTGIMPGQPAYRVLIADDNFESRQLLENLLTSIGFEVRQAANGQEALEIWEAWSPHLVWLDMRMPLMDGYQVADQIKSRSGKTKTVIIALSASVFDLNKEAIFSVGCDDFMLKPFQLNEVYEKIAQHLGVQFIYQESIEQIQQSPRSLRITPEVLSELPVDLIAALKEAVSLGNRKRAEAAILRIQEHSPLTARALNELVQNYRFRDILEMIEKIELVD